MIRKISKLKLNNFFANLQNSYDVFLPIKKGDIYEFELLKNDSIYNMLEPTYSSFKRVIFPEKQEVIKFENDAYFEIKNPQEKIIFGLNAEDIYALNILRDVSLKPLPDRIMQNNLASTAFVLVMTGTISNGTLITSEIIEGYDLLVVVVGDDYYFIPESEKGRKITQSIRMENVNLALTKTPFSQFALFENKELVAEAVERSKDDPIWQKLADICLGCGNCTDVCPLCYCFDTKDNFSSPGCGNRCRMWDSCLYKKFDQTTNCNFRPELKDRIYHYFHHKFVQAYNERGEFNCNHCGRCVKACPVDINIFKVLSDLMKKYKD